MWCTPSVLTTSQLLISSCTIRAESVTRAVSWHVYGCAAINEGTRQILFRKMIRRYHWIVRVHGICTQVYRGTLRNLSSPRTSYVMQQCNEWYLVQSYCSSMPVLARSPANSCKRNRQKIRAHSLFGLRFLQKTPLPRLDKLQASEYVGEEDVLIPWQWPTKDRKWPSPTMIKYKRLTNLYIHNKFIWCVVLLLSAMMAWGWMQEWSWYFWQYAFFYVCFLDGRVRHADSSMSSSKDLSVVVETVPSLFDSIISQRHDMGSPGTILRYSQAAKLGHYNNWQPTSGKGNTNQHALMAGRELSDMTDAGPKSVLDVVV